MEMSDIATKFPTIDVVNEGEEEEEEETTDNNTTLLVTEETPLTADKIEAIVEKKIEETFLMRRGQARTPFQKAIRSVIAHLTEAPTNFHQATTYLHIETNEGVIENKSKLRSLMLFFSIIIVLMQFVAVQSLVIGGTYPSCLQNSQCRTDGQYCKCFGKQIVGICDYCDSENTLRLIEKNYDVPAKDAILSLFLKSSSSTENATKLLANICASPVNVYIEAFCEKCWNRHDRKVNNNSELKTVASNSVLLWSDFITLIFVCIIVSLTIVGELKDIQLCRYAIENAGGNKNVQCSTIINLLLIIRQWAFLPMLGATTPILVLFHGSDSLSICFNAVAVLFLCEVDNIAFYVGLGELTRAQIEEHGRVELTKDEIEGLSALKLGCIGSLVILTIALIMIGNVYPQFYGEGYEWYRLLFFQSPLWVGCNLMELCDNRNPCREKMRRFLFEFFRGFVGVTFTFIYTESFGVVLQCS